ALDAQLVQRLARPLVQPGVIDRRLGQSLARRANAARDRLPLLADLARRRGSAEDERVAQRPIVYALRRAEPAPIDGEPPDAPRSAATITRPLVDASVPPADAAGDPASSIAPLQRADACPASAPRPSDPAPAQSRGVDSGAQHYRPLPQLAQSRSV